MSHPVQPARCARCGEPVAFGYSGQCPRCGMSLSASLAQGQAGVSGASSMAPQVPLADRDLYGTWSGGHVPSQQQDDFDQPTYVPGGGPRAFYQPTAAYPAVPPPYEPPQYGTQGGPSATIPGYGPTQAAGAPMYGSEPFSPIPSRRNRGGGRAALIAGLVVAVLAVFGASAYALVALAGKGTTTHTSSPRASGTAASSASATVLATATPSATATPAEAAIYASSLKGQVFGWPDRSGCTPSADGYHVQADVSCFAPTGDQGDFNLRVTAQQVSGDPGNPFGVTFRGDVNSTSTGINNIYAFFIAGNGHWYFFKFLGGQPTLIQQGSSQAISGSGANVLGVRAQGTHFTLAVNGTTVASADDGSISSGKFGLQGFSGSDIRFTDLSIRGV